MELNEKIKIANKKRKHVGYMCVNYDEPNQSNYENIELRNDDELILLDTGDFFIDYILYQLFTQSSMLSKCFKWIHSSTYDHFIVDGNEYKEVGVEWKEDGSFEIIDHTKANDYAIFKKDMNSFEDYITYWKSWKENNQEFYNKWKEKYKLI